LFLIKRIPTIRNRPPNAGQGFTIYSPTPSSLNTTASESATEPESLATTSSGTVVSRRYTKKKSNNYNHKIFSCLF